MTEPTDLLTISQLANRAGVSTSALRFYEERNLIFSSRTAGNQRRYERAMLRRLGVILAAQAVGLSLRMIKESLDTLPSGRTPTQKDWERLSGDWKHELENRIGELERLRDKLTSCIGCGCLSLEVCQLLNPEDKAGQKGPGPRYVISRRR
jgi:MerR family redox-sensitive transcriptional activator SoxR